MRPRDDHPCRATRLRRLVLVAAAVLLAATLAAMVALPSPAVAATRPTASDIDVYLASKGSPMTGQGAAFMASGGAWKVDPRLLVAIAGAESSFGSVTCAPYNAWGWGCPDGPYDFTSWADGIDTVARGLRTGYLAEGRTTVAAIHQKYAPVAAANDPTGLNNYWTVNVSRFLVEQGGDPNDVDLDGVAGSLPLGPEIDTAAADAFSFVEPRRPGRRPSAAPVLRQGHTVPLVVQVRNSGSDTWTAGEVRLRRVDIDPRVSGAPYAALVGGSVEAGAPARFRVELEPAGTRAGTVMTSWRLEGPTGPFGPVIRRSLRTAADGFRVADAVAEVRPGSATSTVVVTVRNAGTDTWRREGDERVLLGVRTVRGGAVASLGWLNAQVPSALLEREVAPGETGSFAFRVRATGAAPATLVVQAFRGGAWAGGDDVEVTIGVTAAAGGAR